jgi:hypothetical protein
MAELYKSRSTGVKGLPLQRPASPEGRELLLANNLSCPWPRKSLACHVFNHEDTAKRTMASDLSSTLTGLTSQHAVSGACFDAVKVYRKNKNGKTSLCSLLFLALCILYTKYCVPVSRNANPQNGIFASCGSSIPPIVNALWSFILLAPCSLQHCCGQASGLGSCGRFHLEMQARSNLNIQGSGSAVQFYFSISLCC